MLGDGGGGGALIGRLKRQQPIGGGTYLGDEPPKPFGVGVADLRNDVQLVNHLTIHANRERPLRRLVRRRVPRGGQPLRTSCSPRRAQTP